MGLKKADVQAAAIHQATALIIAIERASSLELAELNTLRAGAYLTQVLAKGVIDKTEYDQLNRIASERLSEWLPPDEATSTSGKPFTCNPLRP